MSEQLAKIVDDAALSRSEIEPLTDNYAISLEDAYQIQSISIARRLQRGEKLTGYKLGFTSREKMQQMGVDSIIWGRLTDAMAITNGHELDFDKFIHPKVEPEIVFLLKKPLSGEVTPQQALDAVEAVAPALEIIDSRYRDFKFTHFDVVADNCSSAAYVIGDWHSADTDLSNLAINLKINGSTVAQGNSKAILDHPLKALAEAARCIHSGGESMEAGHIILAGAATAALPFQPGQQVQVDVEQLGSCGFTAV